MKMKKYFAMMMMAVVGFCLTACSDSDDDAVKLVKLTVQVSGVDDLEDFDVELTNTTSTSSYTATTNANGVATFSVTPGVYNATVSETRYVEGYRFVYNGTASNITLTADKEATATIVLKEAISSQVIIKEVYNGGCPKDEGTGAFQRVHRNLPDTLQGHATVWHQQPRGHARHDVAAIHSRPVGRLLHGHRNGVCAAYGDQCQGFSCWLHG